MRVYAQLLFFISLFPASALAQIQLPPRIQAPPQVWTRTASAGLAFTSGNKDTSTLNAAYELIYNPPRRNLIKTDGLFLRGTTDGELTTERLALNARDEYRLRDGVFVFAQTQYLRDRFKEIRYLVAPTAGLGYRVAETAKTRLSFDFGLGGVWEKNLEGALNTSGALVYSEKFNRQLTTTTTLTQSLSVIQRTDDLGDALYQFGSAVSAAITARTQLKVEFLDIFKSEPPTDAVTQNDIALIFALVYKN